MNESHIRKAKKGIAASNYKRRFEKMDGLFALVCLFAFETQRVLAFTSYDILRTRKTNSCLFWAPDSDSESSNEYEHSLQQSHNSQSSETSWTRRQLFIFGGTSVTSSLLWTPTTPARSQPQQIDSNVLVLPTTNTFQNVLSDLPPVPTDYCRLFFCRHGQTENNRLRLVQGSRVDIPLNEMGRQQGRRAGLALTGANPTPPSLIYHSPLIRARQTAEEANREGNLHCDLRVLEALMEVDFGPVAEGQLVEQAKPGMMATYARWSMGNVDYRPKGGGDSARDVLERAVDAVNLLTRVAASDACPSRCVAAFTHSTYLRMLLALFLGDTLAQGANLKTDNGSINVMDVNLKGETKFIGPKSKLVGGFLSQAPGDFRLEIPVAEVVRVNEVRHLAGL